MAKGKPPTTTLEEETKARARFSTRPRQSQKEQGHLHWNFLPEFPHRPGEHGLPMDLEQHAADVTIESICGGINDSQPVEQYDGSLGVTKEFVKAHQVSVGQLQWNNNLAGVYDDPGNVSGVRWCTGTLISNDLFLTAGHCFDQSGGGWNRPKINGTTTVVSSAEIATNMHINFNYQVDPGGNLREEQQFPILELLEYRLNGLDFAIVRLDGNPGAIFGFTGISSADANDGDMLCIIQHPQGLPKRIEAGPLFHQHDNRLGYDDIDTLGGSSGSGVLGPAGTIVGVHTNGGCTAAALSHNHGFRISSIIAASPTITGLLKFSPQLAQYKIDGYGVRLWSSRPTTNLSPGVAVAGIYLYQGKTYRGYAYFFPDGTPLASAVRDSAKGRIFLHLNLSQFHSTLEMLRTEKPVYVYYLSPTNAALRTGREPVGEEET